MSDISTQKFTNISGDNLIILPDITGASNGDVLTYNTTNGIVWNAPERGPELKAGPNLIIDDNGAIGVWTTSTAEGDYAFAIGKECIAEGNYSHAEGEMTQSLGTSTHAEGSQTIASGACSHAEGEGTYTEGEKSHAEGYSTSAIGTYSHAEGYGTIANDVYMHVQGKYNKTSASAAFVIGNGEEGNLSDAFIVDWNGVASATNLKTSAGDVITNVLLTSATNSSTSFVSSGIADLTPLYTYIKSLEYRIALLENK